MGKGNPLMSQMRGKVGDLVFTRLAGEQITRSRNRHPKNPQTIKQMAQRAALATCVEFFTRGQRNLFKFAFESKKPGESDYNAFVRANIANVPVMSHKDLRANAPVFGSFIMSQGSLPSVDLNYDDDYKDGGLVVGALTKDADSLTIGDVSSAIINKYGLQDGDIITIVKLVSTGSVVFPDYSGIEVEGSFFSSIADQRWVLGQFTLNSKDTALIRPLGLFDFSAFEPGDDVLLLRSTYFGMDAFDTTSPSAVAVVVSRNTADGVKVSTSVLKLSETAAKVKAYGEDSNWKEYVAKHWNNDSSGMYTPENILQGSISKN